MGKINTLVLGNLLGEEKNREKELCPFDNLPVYIFNNK